MLSQARKIRKYDAEDVCELLNSCHLALRLDDAVEFLKRSALERGEDPDPKHEEKAVTVSAVTEGLENKLFKIFVQYWPDDGRNGRNL